MLSEEYFFFNSTEEDDREYQDRHLADMFQNFLSNGFFMGLEVESDGDNMDIHVEEGSAFLEGYFYQNTDDVTLTHDSADSSEDRVDRVVIRLDRNQEERNIRARIKRGEVGNGPPELTRDDYIYEISLAAVTIEAGKSFIESYQIEDERGDRDYCGRVERPAKINDQVDSVDIKAPDVRPYQYHHEVAGFYIHGDENSDMLQEWMDDIGISPSDYGRDLEDLRMFVQSSGARTDTGVQTVTIFDWSQNRDYRIYGKFSRASNSAFSANTDWGSWHEEVLESERVESSGGSVCIRYTNGRQICYSSGLTIPSTTNSQGAIYRSQALFWEPPAPFDESHPLYTNVITTGGSRWGSQTGSITDDGEIPYRVFSAISSDSSVTIHIKAEGMWR